MVATGTLGRQASSLETNQKISDKKKGIKQTPEHVAARKEGRKPQFKVGDSCLWFGEQGEVVEYLGIAAAYGDGRRAHWYKVRFGYRSRDLVQDVLEKFSENSSEEGSTDLAA